MIKWYKREGPENDEARVGVYYLDRVSTRHLNASSTNNYSYALRETRRGLCSQQGATGRYVRRRHIYASERPVNMACMHEKPPLRLGVRPWRRRRCAHEQWAEGVVGGWRLI